MPYRTRPTADKGLYPLPGGGFEVRWSVRGKQQWKRLPGYTKTEARDYRNKQIGEKAVPGRLRFADLVRLKRLDAVTKQNRTSATPSRALAEFFGYRETTNDDGKVVVVTPGWKVVEITNAAVHEFEAARTASGAQRSTLQHDLAWLRRALKLAVRVQPEMRCPTIETHDPQNTRTNFPEPEQAAAILKALPEYLRGVVVFAVTTAWRVRSMVLTLRWEHVNWKTQMITLPAELSKNKKPVKLPFGPLPELTQLLEHQLAGAESVSADHVSYNPQGRGSGRPHVGRRSAPGPGSTTCVVWAPGTCGGRASPRRR